MIVKRFEAENPSFRSYYVEEKQGRLFLFRIMEENEIDKTEEFGWKYNERKKSVFLHEVADLDEAEAIVETYWKGAINLMKYKEKRRV